MAARRLRDELLSRRGRGETLAPDSRLRFQEAADLWFAGPVVDLRQSTRANYRSALSQHLRPRFGGRRLDGVTADDMAALVRELRAQGKSEATIAVVLGVIGQVENDDFAWPHRDGLIWPRFSSVVVGLDVA